MYRTFLLLTCCTLTQACGADREAAPTGSPATDEQTSALRLALGTGHYYACTRKDAAYRQGGVKLVVANDDAVAHTFEIVGVKVRTADGAEVATATGFGLFSGYAPNTLEPGEELDDSLGFGANTAVTDALDNEQVVIDVQLSVDGEPRVLSSAPFVPLMDIQPQSTASCPK